MKLQTNVIVCLATAWALSLPAIGLAAPLPPGVKHNDTEMLAKCKERLYMNPGLYFYVCRNGIGARVLRGTRVEQKKNPDRFHPEKKPLVRDMRIELHEGQLSNEGTKKLVEMCRQHNKLVPQQTIVQRKAPPPKKQPGVKKGRGATRGASSVATALAVPKVSTRPLGADKKGSGERFSAHQKRLLRTVCAPYESGGKQIVPPSSKDDLEFVLSLTQSKDKNLRRSAILTCLIHEYNSPYQDNSKYFNLDRNSEPTQRMRAAALRAIRSGEVDLEAEYDPSPDSDVDPTRREGGLIDEVLKDEDETLRAFGKVLDEIVFTQAFRDHNARHARALASGKALRDSRNIIEKVADDARAGKAVAYKTLRVKLVKEPNRTATLQISNQTRKLQRNVLITTRSIADPKLVARAARGYGVQRGLAAAFNLFSSETDAQIPDAIRLWTLTQMQDFGSVIYLPEMSPTATIKVTLCDEDRLRLTKDVRVSFWSDEVISKDIPAYNLSQVLKEVQTPPQASPTFDPKTLTFRPSGASSEPKPKTREQRRREQAVKAQNARIAAQSVQRAKVYIRNGNKLAARVQLEQAIRLAPASSAAKQAKALLNKVQE